MACYRVVLLIFVLLIFSPSSVDMLWVCSCLEWFLCLGLFGLLWSFLWSWIRIHVLLVGICLFLVLVCHEWRWISWTRNSVFPHSQALSSLLFVFCVVLSKSMCISTFRSLDILLIDSAFSLCFFLVAIF